MNARLWLLKSLSASPRFRGRDRLIGLIADSFVGRPVRLPDGTLMYLDPSEWVQLDILVRGCAEPLTVELIRKLVSKGGNVFDIGAHVGHHALAAARAVGPKGHVYAFDPQPYNADRIGRHAALNGLTNIVTVCAAAGDCDGFLRLPMQSDRDRSRLSLHDASPGNLAASVDVPVRRLDVFMGSNSLPPPVLLKIDVEGFELEVLKGLGRQLAGCRNIILEMLTTTDEARNRLVVDMLEASRFELFDVTGKPWVWGQTLVENNLWAKQK